MELRRTPAQERRRRQPASVLLPCALFDLVPRRHDAGELAARPAVGDRAGQVGQKAWVFCASWCADFEFWVWTIVPASGGAVPAVVVSKSLNVSALPLINGSRQVVATPGAVVFAAPLLSSSMLLNRDGERGCQQINRSGSREVVVLANLVAYRGGTASQCCAAVLLHPPLPHKFIRRFNRRGDVSRL